MWRWSSVILILGVMLISPAIGCKASSQADPTVETTVVVTQLPAPSPIIETTVAVTEVVVTPSVPEPNVIEVSGFGDKVTDPFTLARGLTIFTGSNDGSSNFIADLIVWETGETEGLAMNAIGPVTESERSVTVERAGQYTLSVTADGAWSIVVTQPNPLP